MTAVQTETIHDRTYSLSQDCTGSCNGCAFLRNWRGEPVCVYPALHMPCESRGIWVELPHNDRGE
jgi:hypothetical protein